MSEDSGVGAGAGLFGRGLVDGDPQLMLVSLAGGSVVGPDDVSLRKSWVTTGGSCEVEFERGVGF